MKPFSAKAIRSPIALLVLFCVLFALCSCGPIFGYNHEPSASHFPKTKWICRETDLELYTFDIGSGTMLGIYKMNGNQYRVEASFRKYDKGVDLFFYSDDSEVEVEKIKNSKTIFKGKAALGHYFAQHHYDEKAETIVCTKKKYELADGSTLPETIPDTLTFDKEGVIAETPTKRWIAEGVDLYLYSYDDADFYFEGELTIDGETKTVQALEIRQNGYFEMYANNNTLISDMVFERSDDQIIITVLCNSEKVYSCRFNQSCSVAYKDLELFNVFRDLKTITFYPAPIE